jgi:hypothetical protein
LTAAAYFDRETNDEREVRRLADSLYRRVDWRWARNGQATVSHRWKPETGFLRARWQGYNEFLYGAPLFRHQLSHLWIDFRGIQDAFMRRQGYVARGVPHGPDDGTLAPWAVVASLPFAPEIVLPTLQHCSVTYQKMEREYGWSAVSIRRFRVPEVPAGFCRTTSPSIRGRSF